MWIDGITNAELIGGLLLFAGQVLVGFMAARAGLLRTGPQNRVDESSAAQKYQELAAAQAAENQRVRADYDKRLAEAEQKIALLSAVVIGPYEVTVILKGHPNPEVLDARVRLLPRADAAVGETKEEM